MRLLFTTIHGASSLESSKNRRFTRVRKRGRQKRGLGGLFGGITSRQQRYKNDSKESPVFQCWSVSCAQLRYRPEAFTDASPAHAFPRPLRTHLR